MTNTLLCTFRFAFFLAAVLFPIFSIKAQITIINPSTDGGFENGSSFSANGWYLDNGSVANGWYSGNVASIPAGVLAGSRAAYISGDAGATNAYSVTSISVVHLWKDVTIPAGYTEVTLTFNCAVKGEVASNDAIMVSVAPISYTPAASGVSLGTAGLSLPAVTLTQLYNLNAAQTVSLQIPSGLLDNCNSDDTLRLIFTWKNNGMDGVAPSGSIDNISLVASSPDLLSGTYTIGPSGNYTSLTAAAAAVNSFGISAPVVLELQSDYNSAVETFPLILAGQANCHPPGPVNTVTIRPSASAGALSISGSNNSGPLIDINGGNWWIIDGLNTGGTSLTIENTATGSVSTIRLINDASNNTITNCELKGSASISGNNGVVFFSTGIISGNDGNTIDNCRIGPSGTNYPVNAIISAGSISTDNSSNTISNCNIFDYFSATLPSCGINLTSTGNSGWTIKSNRFYLRSAFSYTVGSIHRAVLIGTGRGYTITDNLIGAASPSGTGTYTMAGSVTTRFTGIDVTTTAGSPATEIDGNTVSAISLNTSSTSNINNGVLCGISAAGTGDYIIGSTPGNLVGSASGTSSLLVTIVNSSSSSRGAIVGIHCASTGIVSISNNQIGACTSVCSPANNPAAIMGINVTGSASSISITNNFIGNTTLDNMRAGVNSSTTGSSMVSGIYLNANPLQAAVTGNTIRNMASFGTGSQGFVRGIWTTTITGSSSTGWLISDNTIDNLRTNATTSGFGNTNLCSAIGIHHAASLGCTISGNIISNISNTNTSSASTAVGGIALSATAQSTTLVTEVSRNKIWNLSNTTTSATSVNPSTIFGLGIRSGNNTIQLSNNMISLGSSQSTNTSIIGIWNNNGSTPDPVTSIYHNSVVIDGIVASGALASFGYLRGDLSTTARTVSVELKNNIFDNRRSGGAGQHMAIANNYGTTASTTGWPAGASDYNILNAAVSSTVGYWTSAQSFAGWKSFSSGDSYSQSSGISFAGISSGDLHINTSPTSPAEGNGTSLTLITTDYDGQTRSGLSAADIGADAGNFANYPTVSFTPQPNTCFTGPLTFVATITDPDGVPVSGSSLPVLYWKKNTGSYTASTGSFTGGNQYSFTFGGGVVSGDIISYYFVTQDNAGNAGATPGLGTAGLTISPPAVTTPPLSPYSFLITQTLSGTYTVGTGGNYPTISAAVNAYNSLCISGPVVFSLTDASYPSEIFPITINSNINANASNTLTIKPASSQVTVSGNIPNGPVFKLNGADYVTIDGSINGGTDKNLVITNTASTAPVGLWLSASGSGATNNTVKNCIVNTSAATVVTACGIAVSGTTIFSNGADNDNNSIYNNTITSSNIGLYASGSTPQSNGGVDNLVISGNTFNSVSTSTLFPVIGIQLLNTPAPVIAQNNVSLSCAATTPPVGISLESGVSGASVTRNNITQVTTTNPNGYGGRGITVATGSLNSNITIANNLVAGVNGSNYSSFGSSSSMGIGIGVAGNSSNLGAITGGINLYNNSVNMYGSYSYNANCLTAALYVGVNASALDIRNNLLVNTMNNSSQSGVASKNYSLYSAATSQAFSIIDFNDYYVIGSQGIPGYLGADLNTMAALRSATGKDASSLSAPPSFVSSTNLHLNPTGNDCLDRRGTPVTGVTTDYDGDTRNGSTPDIGMDEFTSTTNFNIQVSESSGQTNNDGTVCAGSTATLTVANGISYSWSTGAGTTSIAVSPVSTTTYSVTISLNGCSTMSSYTINTTPLPVPSVAYTETSGVSANDGIICAGTPATLSAAGGTSYLWNNGLTTSAIAVSPSVTTNYTVTVTSNSLCSATATSVVTINPFPTTLTVTENSGAVANDRVICEGASANLTAPPGSGYMWNTGSSGTSIIVSPSTTTSYSVSLTSVDNCPGVVVTNLTVHTLPVPIISVDESSGLYNDDGVICLNSDVTLTVSGGQSYLWNTGDAVEIITVTPQDTAIFTVTVTNSNSCSASGEVTVIVNYPVSAIEFSENSGLAHNDGVVCAGETAELTASGGNTFVWNTGDNTASVFVTPSESETYYVTVTDENGCVSYNQASVTVNELPVPLVQFSDISGNTDDDGEICSGDLVSISASGADLFEWNNGSVSSEIYESPSTSTTYSVTVTDMNACSSSAEANVVVYGLPNPAISFTESSGVAANDGIICNGSSVTLNAGIFSDYVWDNGSSSAAINVSPVITSQYAVTVTSDAGCTATAGGTVPVNPLPTATISGVTTICNGNSTTLTASGANAFSWSGGLGNNASITVSPASTTSYTVTITNANGCTDTETVTVTVNALPVAAINGITTICNGNSTTLTASGASTYVWSGSLGSNSSATISPSSTTSYTVTVTDNNGCTDTEAATVTVNPLPVAIISGVNTICNGNSTSLTASGANAYAWSGGLGNTSSVTISPSSTTSYTVTITNANGCTDTETATVTVNPLPVAVISGITTICNGNSTTLTASGAGAYAWSGGLGSNSSVTIFPSSTTSYTVTITNGNGCTDTETTIVTVNLLPVANITGTNIICNGNSTTLTASGAGTYVWSGGLGTNSSVTISPSSTTSYTVTITNGNGCTDTETATVTVNPLPVAIISGVTSICNGNSTTLTASGAGAYAWSGSLGTNASVTISPSSTTNYTVTVTDVNGCTDTEFAVVTVNALPVASINGITTICRGSSTTLVASGAITYVWSGGLGTNPSTTVSPSLTTSYTVTITDGNGCTDTETAMVTVNALPAASINGVTTICRGNSTTLVASGAGGYAWSGGLGGNSSVTISPSSTTSYTVTITDGNGCTDTETATVTVNTLPVAVINGVTTICNGTNTTLTASGASVYAWSGGLGTNSSVTVSPSSTIGYTVTITDSNGCTDTETATVTVNQLPVAVINGVNTVCRGNSTTLVALGASTYLWSGGLGTNSSVTISPASTSSYTVTITDGNGCTDTESVTVTVNALPVAVINGVTTICNGSSTTLSASGAGMYAWSGGLGTNSSVTVSPSSATSYTVTITDGNGCTDTESVTVTVNTLPVAVINGVTTICNGNSTTLAASGAGVYAWSGGLGTNSSVTVSPSSTSSYTVTVTDGNGCTDSETKTVIVNVLPVATINGVTTICNGSSTTLSASGAGAYAWSGGLGTNSSVTVSPSSATSYTVTITDGNGCTDTETVTVTVNALPVAVINGVTTICNGSSTTLSASGAGVYAWSGGLGTNSSVTVSPSSATSYTVTITDGNGCTDTETVTVTVNALPVAVINGVTTICTGNSTTLAASGAGVYAWSGGLGTNSSVTVSPSSTSSYTVTITDGNGCTDSETKTVIVNALPVATINGVTTICNGSSTTLSASGAGAYAWSGGLGTNSSVTVSPSSATSYTVTITDGNGCTDTETVTVTVNALPVAVINGVTTICNGNSTTLSASGAGVYAWSGGLGTNSSVTVSPSSATSYTVTITEGNGCTDTETVTVMVNALPVAVINGVTTICNGNSTTLSASGAGVYAWSGGLGTNSSVTVSPSSTSSYTVTITDGNGCTDSETKTVIVNALPVATINGVTTICNGSSTTLSASGAGAYAWSGGLGTNSSVTVSPSSATSYTVTITDGNGCTDTETVTVTVNALPVAVINGVTTICNGSSTTLAASGAGMYAWSGGLGTNSSVTVSPSSATSYMVTITDGNGCTDTESVTVTVNANPVAVITGVTTICSGTVTTLLASGNGTFTWSGGLGNNAAVAVSPLSSSSYTVTVTSSNGCTDSKSVLVNVNPVPNAVISGFMSVCAGSSTTLTASGAGNGTYKWSGGLGNSAVVTVSPVAATAYTVTVTGINGCSDTETAMVTVNQPPVAVISGTTAICAGSSTTLTASGSGTYLWSGGLGSSPAVTVSPVFATTYTVTVTGVNGCTSSASAQIGVWASPVAVINGVSGICAGNSTTLTASGSGTYLWSGGLGTGSSVTVSPVTTTIYTVTVTNSNGCTDSKSASVTVSPAPTPAISGVTAICSGNITTLTASGGTAYLWSSGSNTASVQVAPANTTTYTVTVTNNVGCTATKSVQVAVQATPVIVQALPISGSVGTIITITGLNFIGVTQVKLNGVNCPVFTVISQTQINVAMPFSGNILTISANMQCGTVNFNTNDLSISSVNPLSGSPGTVVRITGNNMINVQTVTIGGTPQLILSATATYVDIFVMPGSSTGTVTASSATATATSADIFTVNATPVPKVQQGSKLTALGASGTSLQATSVAVSADGNTAIVGAPSDNNNVGGAWIYIRNGTSWTQQGGKLTGTGALGLAKQGTSVAISADGNTVAIGGSLDNLSAGAVWVFRRSGTAWSQQGGKLTGSGASGNAQLGASLSMSADGNTIAAGGIADNTFTGAVWVFARTGSNWVQQGGKLVGSGAVGSARQGCSVALSSDGKYLVSGGYNDDNKRGAVWIYERTGGTWLQQGSKLIGSLSSANAFQGYSVAISANGGTILSGGPNDALNNTGAAWVFVKNGNIWMQQGDKLLGTGWINPSRQGGSVALSADGNTAVSGGFGDNNGIGAMWTFKRTGTIWSQSGTKMTGTGALGQARQCTSLEISSDGSTAVIGGPGDASGKGAVWVYISGSSLTDPDMETREILTSLPDTGELILDQNMPNPFSSRTLVRFITPAACTAVWQISDMNGRVVEELKRDYPAGDNSEVFDMNGYQGVYYYTLKTPFGTKTRKMIVLK